ncbi:MAG TPA: acyloxyacyl hydrolase [Acidobacteriaceae bacterium]
MRKPPSMAAFDCEGPELISKWMQRWMVAAVAVGALATGCTVSARAQAESPVQSAAEHHPWQYGVELQGGNGLTDNRGGFHFLMAGVQGSKVLTPQIGNGLLRGNFAYGVEIFPFWQSYTPHFQRANCYATQQPGTSLVGPGTYCTPLFTVGGTYTGASITPVIFRWNFTSGKRWMPWVQGAGGLIWTNHKYPAFGSDVLNLNNDGPGANTSVWNFTPQFGVGTHYFVKPKRSIDFGANAIHVSSASLGDKNPGVNASVQVSLGYSWWK